MWLLQRERRVQKLNIVPLSPADAARFGEAWRGLQALSEADRLVRELMMKRGHPMGDFESRAADISVDHPMVVDHYRALFAELLEVAPQAQQQPAMARQQEVRR